MNDDELLQALKNTMRERERISRELGELVERRPEAVDQREAIQHLFDVTSQLIAASTVDAAMLAALGTHALARED